MVNTDAKGIRYSQSPISFRTAISLYLRSRNCYNELRKSFNLPHPKTINSCFGKLETPGSIDECQKTVDKVFSSLTGNQLYAKILVDEIHIAPSIRYRGNHVIGNSIDQPEKAARTCLGLLVETMYGGPSFMGRILPVYSIDADLLFDQIEQMIKIVHNAGGYVFLVMSDDLRANQKTFQLFHEKYGSQDIYAIIHPISNTVFSKLYLLFDPTHLFKNVRNNWVTEKMKTLDFIEPFTKNVFQAKWSDLIALYEKEVTCPIKMTKLSYASLYPTNFEKQKVNLVVNVFNEKTIAALKVGKEQACGTMVMIENVTQMWHILNVKSPNVGYRLNDDDRKPVSDVNDTRLAFLTEIAGCFNSMTSKYVHRVRSLTDDTRKGLFLSLLVLLISLRCSWLRNNLNMF